MNIFKAFINISINYNQRSSFLLVCFLYKYKYLYKIVPHKNKSIDYLNQINKYSKLTIKCP